MFWEAKNSTVLSKLASLPRPVRKNACPMVMRVRRGARKARAAAALSPNRAARGKGAGAGIHKPPSSGRVGPHPTSADHGKHARTTRRAGARDGRERGLG